MSEAADRLQTDSQFGRKTRSEALGPSARDAPRSCKKRSTHARRACILHPVCNCVCSLLVMHLQSLTSELERHAFFKQPRSASFREAAVI